MKPKSFIENKIETALASLDGATSATPSPFFYAKVMGRLSRRQNTVWEIFNSYISRPVVAFATICIIFIVNIIAVYSNSLQNTAAVPEQNEIASADEYTQVTDTFYELENLKP